MQFSSSARRKPQITLVSTLSHKRHDFRNKLFNIKYFDLLYNFCLKHFLFLEELSKIYRRMHICRQVKCPLRLSGFIET